MASQDVKPITVEEARTHIEYISRIQNAGDDDERAEVLIEEMLAFGDRTLVVWEHLSEGAPDDQRTFFETIYHLGCGLFVFWLEGAVLTNRPDEAERRALAGLSTIHGRIEHHHFGANAILELPENHPQRDVALARRLVLDELAWLKERGENTPWYSLAGALRIAYLQHWGTNEELQSWEGLAAEAAAKVRPATAHRLWGAVLGHYLYLALDDPATWMPEAFRIQGLMDALAITPELKAESYLSAARLYRPDDDQRPRAELLKRAIESGGFGERMERAIAIMEARVRVSCADAARVIELLQPRLEGYEDDYITSITDKDRRESGDASREVSGLLAFALAVLGRWYEAVETIERGKCLRQRMMRALRQTPEAAALLEIEGELYAVSRRLAPERSTPAVEQVRDWFAAGLSPHAQLQEEYRRTLPNIAGGLRRAVSAREIAGALRPGEAALSLGLAWPGLMAALIVDDENPIVGTLLRGDISDTTLDDWLFGAESEPGFLRALERGIAETDLRSPLETLLGRLDEAIGAPVADVLRERGLKRLVVLPHHFLRLAPLWALPSWREFDVRMAPGAFALLRDQRPTLRGRALIAANPTMDLPLATTEAAVAAERLAAVGLETLVLAGAAATETALTEALQTSSLLHFAGHGIASLRDASMSALLVSPTWEETPVLDARALLALETNAAESQHVTVEREEGSPRRKIYFDYAKRGTLYAEAMDGDVLLAGELWRTGDILVQGTLEGCALAFLCACSSGLGSIEALQEASGLPAAMAVAGVGCVIGTGWPVADEITMLFADELYARAVPDTAGVIDVVGAVRGAAVAIRAMEREEAVRRVESLAAKAAGRTAKLQLNVLAKRLSKGAPRPFDNPFDTGAFFVTGAAEVILET
jgi:CHAT domain-containing protein